jgi:hypothetical protein
MLPPAKATVTFDFGFNQRGIRALAHPARFGFYSFDRYTAELLTRDFSSRNPGP